MVPGIKRTTLNVGVLWTHKIVSVIASFVITGIATGFYGLDQMGIWVLATSVAAYLQMLDFGTSSALPRIVPRLRAVGNEQGVMEFVSTTFALTVAVAIIGLVSLPWLSLATANAFSVKPDNLALANILFGIAILTSMLGLPLRTGYGLLASLHRFDIYFGLDLIAVLIRVLLAYIVVKHVHAEIVAFALVVMIPPLMVNFFQYRAGLHFNDLKITWRSFSIRALRELISHSGASLVLTFSALLLIQGGAMYSAGMGTSAVAIFSFPLLLANQAMSFGAAASGLVAPVASSLGAHSNRNLLREVTIGAIHSSSSVSALTVLLLLLTGPFLLNVWLAGPAVDMMSLHLMAELLAIFVLGAAFIAPAAAIRGVLMGGGRHWVAAFAELLASGLGLAAGIVMMNYGGLGLNGLAYGVSLAFIMRYLLLLRLVSHEIEASQISLLLVSARPFLVGLIALGSAIWLFGIPDINSTFYLLSSSCALAISVWALGTWLWVLDAKSRLFVASRVRKLLATWW